MIGTFLICDVVSRAFVSASYVSYNAINRIQSERERARDRLTERDGGRETERGGVARLR